MSYLHRPRIVFSGSFQADVSTVNNDVRHFDNATFLERFQEFQKQSCDPDGTIMNGWWNPEGTGAFRLIDVKVTGAETATAVPGGDPAVGLFVNAQHGRTAAKLVDVDPQFQMASQIWGLRLVLTDGEREFMRALYAPTSFRDLYFLRVCKKPGSGNASASFPSFLHEIEWTAHADGSPALRALREAADANQGRLCANFMTYGYKTGISDSGYTFGKMVGAIGPWHEGEPLTFAPGRRFAPRRRKPPPYPFASATGVGFFTGAVVDGAARAVVDLGNALPMSSADGTLTDIGTLILAILKTPDREETDGGGGKIIPGIEEGQSVTPDDYVEIGRIDYRRDGWLDGTAGIAGFDLSADAKAIIDTHPWALIASDGAGGGGEVAIRETFGGLFVRADDFVKRTDAVSTGAVRETTMLHASRYGLPLANVPLVMTLDASEQGQGGGGGVDQPKAPIPDIGVPRSAIGFENEATTDSRGQCRFEYWASDPGNPRKYIDGQIYKISYQARIAGQSPVPLFEQIILHVRDAFSAPARPTWENDIAPVMVQYGNLYPIMSKGLFDFSDKITLSNHARLLYFVLSRPIDDPNHMPATRDMSAGKRNMVLSWLAGFTEEAVAPFEEMPVAGVGAGPAGPVPVTPADHVSALSAGSAAALEESLGDLFDGKSAALRQYAAAHKERKT